MAVSIPQAVWRRRVHLWLDHGAGDDLVALLLHRELEPAGLGHQNLGRVAHREKLPEGNRRLRRVGLGGVERALQVDVPW